MERMIFSSTGQAHAADGLPGFLNDLLHPGRRAPEEDDDPSRPFTPPPPEPSREEQEDDDDDGPSFPLTPALA